VYIPGYGRVGYTTGCTYPGIVGYTLVYIPLWVCTEVYPGLYASLPYYPGYTYLPTTVRVYLVVVYTVLSVRTVMLWAQKERNPWVRRSLSLSEP